MPRPPDIDALGKLNFVVNYFLHGCTPPIFLFCQFAQEPAKDMLLMFLLPDLTDIGQAVFDPQHGRRRKPGRHGRKKRRGGGFPDPSDLIGQRVRGVINPHNALKFGPVNWAFRIWNRVEAVNFTCAVIEGLADTAYSGLLGVLETDPFHCKEFARMVRTDTVPQLGGGAGPPIWPIAVSDLEASTGFTSTQFQCRAFKGAYVVHFSCTLEYAGFDFAGEVSVALGVVGGVRREISQVATLNFGDTITLEVSMDFEEGEAAEWGLGNRFGFFTCVSRQVVAFGKADIPWPF